MMHRIARFKGLLAAGALVLTAPLAHASASGCPVYKMVVPAAPGGTTDLVGRLIAVNLAEKLGGSVIVENKSGGGGVIGAAQVATSSPDGCTMLMGNIGPNAINYSLNKSISYAPSDLQPVTSVFAVPNVLVVHPSVQAKDVQELIALARSQPGRLALANSGVGQSTHMTGEMFRLKTGVEVISVPYKGNAPAVADLLAGQVHMMFDNVAVSLPHIKDGRLKALAVTSSERAPGLPDVPTMAEAGLDGFDVVAWFGLFYPAKTDRRMVETLQQSVSEILQRDSVKNQILAWSGIPGGEPTADFEKYVAAEIQRWKEIVTAANLSVN